MPNRSAKIIPDRSGGSVSRGVSLFSSRILARNMLLNVAGQGIPMISALVAIPILIHAIGTDRYGVLTIIWMVINYFYVFDMGISRSTTKFVSEYAAKEHTQGLPELISTSAAMLLFFGIIGGIIAFLLSGWITESALKIPSELVGETKNAFRLLSCIIPVILSTVALRGLLEARQRFDITNMINVPGNIATFISPLAVLPFTKSLYAVAASLVVTRLAVFVAYLFCARRVYRDIHRFSLPKKSCAKKLLGYGGWLTFSSVVSPVMSYLDRFIIGALLGVAAVAFYTTPFDMVSRLYIIPGSVLSVMFPVFSAYSSHDNGKIVASYVRVMKYVSVILAPVILCVIAFSSPFLGLWLGNEFQSKSAFVMQILAFGVLVNSVSQVPYSAIQAAGRPDITAKLHCVELPLYGVFVYLLAMKFGIVGAALAWSLRVICDYFLLTFFASKILGVSRHYSREVRLMIVVFILAGGSVAVSEYIAFVPAKVLLLIINCAATVSFLWFRLVDKKDKETISRLMPWNRGINAFHD